jgi:hypothetical protein
MKPEAFRSSITPARNPIALGPRVRATPTACWIRMNAPSDT